MSDALRVKRLVGLGLWGGVIGLAALTGVLRVLAGLALPDAILLAVLLVGMPVLALVQAPLLEDTEIERQPAYWSSIVTLWLLGTATWLVGTRDGGLPAIGVVELPALAGLVWVVGLTAAGLGTIVAFRFLAGVVGTGDSRVVHELMPRTPAEKATFGLVSLAAGVAEEVAYRGYAILILLPLLGPFGSLILTSAVFGVLHVYQGVLGIFRTATMGAVLGWGFLASGSVVPVMIAHVLIDILAGIVLADRLLVPKPGGGVGPDDGPVSPASP